jgi:hypothetical protein
VPLVLAPRLTVFGLVALATVVVVAVRPPAAAYILLATTPLIVGVDRGSVFPLFRPSETLALLAAAGLVVHGLLRARDEPVRLRLRRLDASLVLLALAGSVLPLLTMAARNRTIAPDDVLYALVLWKYLMIFLVVRASVRNEAEVRRCLWLSLAAASVVAVVAILQSLKLFGVPELLARYYSPLGDERVLFINRGTSTLASSLATGDVMAFNLGIALAWLVRTDQHRLRLTAATGLFALGGLASGQFSAVIALASVVAAVGLVTRRLTRTALRLLPVGLVAAVVLEPVIERRLRGFSSSGDLPSSWLGRLYDLRTYYWPELFSDYNFVLGVRPAARLPARETWRTYVWIESGHTWLLWSGGILLFAAFFVFLVIGLRATLRIARSREDTYGTAAVAAFAALAAVAVLMTFDAHLILRGAGELLFSLLALAVAAPPGTGSAAPAAVAGQGVAVPSEDGRPPGPRRSPRMASPREWSSGERHAR